MITKRVVPTWFEATPDEQRAVMDLISDVKILLEHSLTPTPDGWNISFSAGIAAGQAVPHLHVHVIPRWHGDVPDPGGITPANDTHSGESAARPADFCTGHPDDPFLRRLLAELPGATAVDILAAFVQPSGVAMVEPALLSVMRGGASVRVLAGDYLGISSPVALRGLLTIANLREASWPMAARLDLRVLELARIATRPTSFHPKAWRIVRPDRTIVWVGSSNLSGAALLSGIEWNLRVTSLDREATCQAVTQAFDGLWNQAGAIDETWIAAYASRPRPLAAIPQLFDTEPTAVPWEPRPWQIGVLRRLIELRAMGHRRALAVVATGMGKTVLGALDAAHLAESSESPLRVIIIAHRAELLAQSATTVSRALGLSAEGVSWCVGQSSDLSGRLVLASVQKLARPEMLERLAAEPFDYAIVDEVHHAEAPTWRRVLDCLNAGFLLGLTATPERADGRDVATIFDDVIACDIGIADGIREGALVPFAYHGLNDDTDYTQIPWRNGRFDETELEQALIDSPRMERLWRAWSEHPGQRTLVFCAGQRHALFTRDWLRRHGISAEAVFTGPASDDRGEGLRGLESGRLQALCAVDLFNEGIDLPTVDRVVMLRPTESTVIFTQQLGRGLRTAAGKRRLVVIDYVGNHRLFGRRVRHLLALAGLEGGSSDLRSLLDGKPLSLPPGCLIDVDVEAKDLLRSLLAKGGNAVADEYRRLREELGRRPTPSELAHRGYLPGTLRARYDSWFSFVAAEGDLDEQERTALKAHGDWLEWVESTNLNKSLKMVALRTLLDGGALLSGQDLIAHATKARASMLAHPVLRDDLQANQEISDHGHEPIEGWPRWWQRESIETCYPWLSVSDDQIRSRLDVAADLKPAFLRMTDELIQWRLTDYAARRHKREERGFTAKVSHANGRPILFLPSRDEAPDRPTGPTLAVLPDGTTWSFRFVKVACNVAMPEGEPTNRLPELLRDWFGASAGLPGTNQRVYFTNTDGRWTIAPIQAAAETSEAPVASVTGRPSGFRTERPKTGNATGWIPVVELAAAATAFSGDQNPSEIGWAHSEGKVPTGAFVAQVRGRSMEPTITDGAWCLFRPPTAGSREGKVLLVAHHAISDPEAGGRFTVKRYRSTKLAVMDDWKHASITLMPDNPAFAPIGIDEHQAGEMAIVAEFVRVWPSNSAQLP